MLDNCSLSPHSVQPVKKKHRARMIEYFIDVARECFNIGNFNSLMAIICECFLRDTFPLFVYLKLSDHSETSLD